MAVIKSVSMSEQDARFIVEHELSPSALLQSAIQKVRDRNEGPDPGVTVEKKLEIMSKRYSQSLRYIEKEGRLDDFFQKKNNNQLEE